MNKKPLSHIIRDLHQRVRSLEEENASLSDQMEDILLFKLLMDNYDDQTKPTEFINTLLEKISVVKDVPFCLCLDLKPRTHKTVGHYCAHTSCSDGLPKVHIDSQAMNQIKGAPIAFLTNTQTSLQLQFDSATHTVTPRELLSVAFHNEQVKNGVFLFAKDHRSEGTFKDDQLVYQQFVQLVKDKWERIGLLKQLHQLNNELERKVKLRTSELTRLNNLLFKEIQINDATTQELLIEKEKFQQLFNNATDAIYLWELNERNEVVNLIEANIAATHMTGYSLDELKKMTPQMLMSKAFKDQGPDILEKIDTHKTLTFEVEHQHKNKTIIPVEISSHKFVLNKKQVVLSISRDITERKNIEKELIKAKEKAEESDRLKSAFLANMSHEIRTPMNAILGFAEILQTDHADVGDIKDYASIIMNNSIHLLNLINDIVDYSKIEAGQVELHLSPVNIKQLLLSVQKTTISLLRHLDKTDIEALTDLQDLPDDVIMLDEVKVRQVLNNLVNNAAKFTNQGSITIGMQLAKGGFIEFWVKDTGKGIPLKYKNLIFKRFVQIKDETFPTQTGTGLGLAICQNLVELMGGKIHLSSSSEEGSTFRFTIPYLLRNER